MRNQSYFFQIGFNKCATTALAKLFQNSGQRMIHGNAKRAWRQSAPGTQKRGPQEIIDENIRLGRPALKTYEAFHSFFDMALPHPSRYIENFKQFPTFARDYPNAKFILNIRDKTDWIRSRMRHKNGTFLAYIQSLHQADTAEVLRLWSDDWDQHLESVQSFFAHEQDRLIVFDVDNTPLDQLIAFCAPEIALDPSFWQHRRVTNVIAAQQDWEDAHKDTVVTEDLLIAA